MPSAWRWPRRSTAGKRLSEALGDVAGAARAFEYYAGACDKHQGESIPLGPDYLAYTVNEPAGVAAQIVPWNYPDLHHRARPGAGAGRGLHRGGQTRRTDAADRADAGRLAARRPAFPRGVCNVVTGTGAAAGAPLVAHAGIDHITFTGSVATGQAVMRAAADHVTRLVLELGGKSPVVVLADCDFDSAVDNAFGAIFENAGQICSAGSRLVIARAHP